MMNFEEMALENEKKLKDNIYPGRGIVIGGSPDGKNLIQVYWIMGRSVNSRNRVFENENGFVRTKAFDESKVTDPSLIIYYPAKDMNNCHIITNGDQTDTIYDFIKEGKCFQEALCTRTFEPDAPNYTPRISGAVNLGGKKHIYELSVLKSQNNNPEYCQRSFFKYEKALPGFGHCIHTYKGDGDPLPSFEGEPYLLKLTDDIDEVAQHYWGLLNEENRVSLMAKFINIESGKAEIRIINKNK